MAKHFSWIQHQFLAKNSPPVRVLSMVAGSSVATGSTLAGQLIMLI